MQKKCIGKYIDDRICFRGKNPVIVIKKYMVKNNKGFWPVKTDEQSEDDRYDNRQYGGQFQKEAVFVFFYTDDDEYDRH